jgi:hypothetical protein
MLAEILGGTMLYFRSLSIVAAAMALAMIVPMRAASAACIAIRTIGDLDQIRTNLAGNFCLKNALDFAGIGNFTPIGSLVQPFTGVFDGEDNVIRRLSVAPGPTMGLFGWVTDGHVQHLKLAGNIVKSAQATSAGLVAGGLSGTAGLFDVQASGAVNCSSAACHVGGLVGDMDPGVEIWFSSSAAWVAGGNGGAAGGIAGQSSGRIVKSYAGGRVICGANCAVGGMVGFMEPGSLIERSFAVGAVIGTDDGSAGGLVGTGYGQLMRTYATGSVEVGNNALIAALIGYHGGRVWDSYSVGRVRTGTGDSAGGLIAVLATPQAQTDESYWDLDTTRQGFSAQGSSRATTHLQAALPIGFGPIWAITKGYSYPFLNLPDMPFASTLATVVKAGRVFTFVPLEQFEPTEYLHDPSFADSASLAAVYTMIARGIGFAQNNAALAQIKIDQDFWHDATKTTTWAGAVTGYASLASPVTLGPSDQINDSNIIGQLKLRNIVAISGQYTASGGGTATQWMLATLFKTDGSNVTTSLVANDPWTGQQVFIDPTTRQVTQPANFPLANFRVNGYAVVTLN